MTTPAISTRTVVRDAIVLALGNLKGQSTARNKTFAVSLRYLTETETKQATTYCVVCTNEQGVAQTQQHATWDLTVLIVIWAYDTNDPRAKLDACLEDVYETMLLVQATMRDVVWKMTLGDIQTDDGTTAAGDWAQGIQRWTISHRRRMTVN